MTTDYLASLYDFDSRANQMVLDGLRALPEADERSRKVIAHLVAGKQLWLRRLQGEDTAGETSWPELDWDACARQIAENRAGYAAYLRETSEAELDEEFVYHNSSGTGYRVVARDVLTHVLLHGSHHRGQLAAAIRAQGGEPPKLDYIFHHRTEAG